MENVVRVNKDVNIVAYYFHNRGSRLKCYPKKMEYSGKSIIFTETGLRHPVKKGQRMVHVFDMTDGSADYRLEFDKHKLNWRLVTISIPKHIESGSGSTTKLSYRLNKEFAVVGC